MKRRLVVTLAAAIALGSLAVGTVAADGGRATRGDAIAVLEAPTLGLLGSMVEIRPLPPFDGAHYCALDWHTIVLAYVAPGPAPEARALIDDVDMLFELDGAALAVTRTAVKAYASDDGAVGPEGTYFAQWGRIMAPSDIAVGSHTLSVLIFEAGELTIALGITFHVDAAGTGACL